MPMHKTEAGWIWCVELDGFLVTVIADDKLAEVVVPRTRTFAVDDNGVVVDVHPVVEVVPLETEYYDDDNKGSCEHFFDVYLGDEITTFHASVSGGKIMHIERLY